MNIEDKVQIWWNNLTKSKRHNLFKKHWSSLIDVQNWNDPSEFIKLDLFRQYANK